jgi:choline dehydrogenase-like flavoprotein
LPPLNETVVEGEYDYIVVGAGAAGSVVRIALSLLHYSVLKVLQVATRLSEEPGVRVLLLEAGIEDHNMQIRMYKYLQSAPDVIETPYRRCSCWHGTAAQVRKNTAGRVVERR